MKFEKVAKIALLCFTTLLAIQLNSQETAKEVSLTNNTQKPWTRWWWMGSAVDKQNIKSSLDAFSKAGLGGVEITPIYGVKGENANDVTFLSPQWLDLLDFTIKTADSLGMQVDMNLGTGWPLWWSSSGYGTCCYSFGN